MATDPDGTNELIWLGDNSGKFGFSGYVGDFKSSDNLIKEFKVEKKGFYHNETWHWEYLVDTNTYINKGKKYKRIDCFIAEERNKLLK